jgi:hypothetical protein
MDQQILCDICSHPYPEEVQVVGCPEVQVVVYPEVQVV